MENGLKFICFRGILDEKNEVSSLALRKDIALFI